MHCTGAPLPRSVLSILHPPLASSAHRNKERVGKKQWMGESSRRLLVTPSRKMRRKRRRRRR